MILAGSESSATTVEWAMAELMANPSIRKQAQEELDRVVGNARLVQEADLPNLPLLAAIVKETFRLHPPVPLSLPRSSNQPCVVAGRQFPVNTRLLLNIFAIHRDPSVYEHPDAFQPSRSVIMVTLTSLLSSAISESLSMEPANACEIDTTIFLLKPKSCVSYTKKNEK